ncbi:MAG: 3-oxoacid CoA-transferase subunit B [Anaeromyxobacteraceae bacterium]
MTLTREGLARRAAREVVDGTYVNLGIGIPTLVASFIQPQRRVTLQSENGLLGIGPYPTAAQVDPELINAGKETITAISGASVFDSATSFAMIRGGHVDLAILGGLEVSAQGDLANWTVPGKMVKGMGGAMDLVHGARRVVVVMDHCDRSGRPKVVERCTLPLTGRGVVHRVITDMAVLDVTAAGLVLREVAAGLSVEDVRRATGAPLLAPDRVERLEG